MHTSLGVWIYVHINLVYRPSIVSKCGKSVKVSTTATEAVYHGHRARMDHFASAPSTP